MAKYLILIYGDEGRWESMSPQERGEIDAGHATFRQLAGTAVLASGELEAARTARSLRAGPGGKPTITDGPFLEGKEVVGGFYVIEAANHDEAASLAGVLAEVRHDHSGVQIHPLVEHGTT